MRHLHGVSVFWVGVGGKNYFCEQFGIDDDFLVFLNLGNSDVSSGAGFASQGFEGKLKTDCLFGKLNYLPSK